MINKIQQNIAFILVFFIVLGLIIPPIIKYNKLQKEEEKIYLEESIKCKNDELPDYLCKKYDEPYKKRDTLNTFAYITLAYESFSTLQILAPLFIIVISTYQFHKYMYKGYLCNSLTRNSYKNTLLNLYKNSLKYALFFPVILLLVFIISYFISGNFDYQYGTIYYGFSGFGNSSTNFLFMPVYLFVFFLHSIFYINIGIYNCRYNKNYIINVIVSYIEFFLILVIFEIVFADIIFSNSVYKNYFFLANIWGDYSHVTFIGMIIFALFLDIISGLFVYKAYKDKEKVLVDILK